MQKRLAEREGEIDDLKFEMVQEMVDAGLPLEKVMGLYEQTLNSDDLSSAIKGPKIRLTKEESVLLYLKVGSNEIFHVLGSRLDIHLSGHEWHPL